MAFDLLNPPFSVRRAGGLQSYVPAIAVLGLPTAALTGSQSS